MRPVADKLRRRLLLCHAPARQPNLLRRNQQGKGGLVTGLRPQFDFIQKEFTMSRIQRISAMTVAAAAIAGLAACASPNYGSAYPTYPTQQTTYPSTAPAYTQYGTVRNVEYLRTQGQNQGVVGAVAGGVAGGVLGSQVGGGTGRTAATVAGVVGGALIGRAIERNVTGGSQVGSDVYRVTVQLDDGSTRAFDYEQAPNVRIGDRVRMDGNQLYR